MTEKLAALIDSLEREAERDRSPAETPEIGIVMGSDSDLDVMMG
ncbi:5-(carboxyamino)imidazole ribonucleotide mutase, partial [Halobacteriales archaeon SW_10_66_29]